ncbi:MAG TPA: ABC transporter permease [Chloroflexota bacterium]|jgi:ABC-type transport system involved in multi-copper enzyme maturation permease subunit|nr:ABC transporter permease [Chloroflexota bacterium]
MALLTIAGLTLREASRRKLLIALVAITLIVIPLVGWGFSRIPTIHCRQGCSPADFRVAEAGILILVAYMFAFVIAVAAPFMAAPAIASDIESHLLLGILPRPIRRSELVVGKWMGLVALVGGYAIFACGLQFVAVRIAVGYVPPHPILTTLFIVAEAVALLTLGILGSTRLSPITCGIVAVALFGVTWIIGIAGQIGAADGISVLANVGTASSLILPTDGLWRAAVFNLEPVSILAVSSGSREAAANPFVVLAAPTAAYVAWALLWIGGILALAVKSFSTREV